MLHHRGSSVSLLLLVVPWLNLFLDDCANDIAANGTEEETKILPLFRLAL